MGILNLLSVSAPTGLWGNLINWLSKGIASYAVVLIVLTLLVKMVMLPLDVFNKYTTKVNSRKQAEVAPEIEKINKRYANNKQMINQKAMEVYKKHHYNIYGTCGTMLVYMILTMVIFFTLFSSLNKMSAYKIYNEYTTLRSTYCTEFGIDAGSTDKQIIEATTLPEGATEEQKAEMQAKKDKANKAVVAKYADIKEGFLWIKNIWRPDSSAKPVLEYNKFISNSRIKKADVNENVYNLVMGPVAEANSGWNGYFLLAVLTAGTTLGSVMINNWVMRLRAKRKNKVYIKGADANKGMMIFMPIIMGIFTLFYNAAFGIYILTGNLFMLVTGPLITLLVEWIDEKKVNKENEKTKISYSRK